ncbi:MAG TPA: c-type cytochrome [Candidatus Binatia bacterium]|nr:c-type cytochrome [Candidatus Binatia bacterium]
MRSGIRGVLATCAAMGLVGSLGIGAARAENQGDVEQGKKLYMKYCATCHGPSGTGDGVAASTFKTKPVDLTMLAKQSNGTFPTMKVLSIVKGDSPVAAHGSREMPVWGEILGRPLDTGMYKQDDVDLKILSIVSYLKSIQK